MKLKKKPKQKKTKMRARLFNKKEAASYMGVSTPTLYKMIRQGRLNEYYIDSRRTTLISNLEMNKLLGKTEGGKEFLKLKSYEKDK